MLLRPYASRDPGGRGSPRLAALRSSGEVGSVRLARLGCCCPGQSALDARFVGFAQRPELTLGNVDDRREQQPAVLHLFETQKLSGKLPADADLPAPSYALSAGAFAFPSTLAPFERRAEGGLPTSLTFGRYPSVSAGPTPSGPTEGRAAFSRA
jgi:hypothetical protein